MGIQEDIQELKEIMKTDKLKEHEKKFKLPWGKKVSKSQKSKNFVSILILNENGVYEWKKYRIEDQTILHETIPRLASSGYVMFDKKGNPLIILPNWSVEPFSPMASYKESIEDGNNTVGFSLLMARMEKEKITSKPKMGNGLKWILGLALAAIIGYALITGGGS